MRLIAVILLVSGALLSHAQSRFGEITVADFEKEMGKASVVILDVRTSEEVQGGVIGKPVIIDYFSKGFEKQIGELDKSKTYLIYCASGYRSGEAVNLMKARGFAGAFSLKGGIQSWKRARKPLSKSN